jgi:putative ABC transport system ATP-binding protein
MLLQLHDVSFSYGGAASGPMVLEGLDLSVEPGEFVMIQGASGSGKSTILRLICRLQAPVAGTILFREKPVVSIKPSLLRSSICYVPQVPVMVEGSVADNLLLPFSFEANRSGRKPSTDEIESMLHRFYLGEISPTQSAQNLSVGQKQRLALMRALLQGPELLLLDEPTSALDRESSTMVFSIIERLNTEEGKTVIIVTHSDYSPHVPQMSRYLLRNHKLEPA